MPTLLQKRFVEQLPKNDYKVSKALLSAGYSKSSAHGLTKEIMQSKGVQELLEDIGMTDEFLVKEYKKIAKQDRDLTNKRLAIEKTIDYKHPELSRQSNQGNTYNTQVNILSTQDRQAKIAQLEQALLTK